MWFKTCGFLSLNVWDSDSPNYTHTMTQHSTPCVRLDTANTKPREEPRQDNNVAVPLKVALIAACCPGVAWWARGADAAGPSRALVLSCSTATSDAEVVTPTFCGQISDAGD